MGGKASKTARGRAAKRWRERMWEQHRCQSCGGKLEWDYHLKQCETCLSARRVKQTAERELRKVFQ